MLDSFHSCALRAIPLLRRFSAAVMMSLLLAAAGAAQTAAPVVPDGTAEVYRLGPSDRISVRVVAWDSMDLTFVRFDELGGEYAVGADGTVLLPLIGSLQAAGLSPAELSEVITAELQNRLGSAEPPSTVVEVQTYRPVYVIGDVQRPGAYEFRPGLRADQAVALAGGLLRSIADAGIQPQEVIRIDGSRRELEIDRTRLELRAARLQAEMDGAEDFEPPLRLSHPDGPEALQAMIERERSLMQSRRESQQRALESFETSRQLLRTEAEALEEKLEGQERQIEIVGESVGNMEQLMERGLARSPNLVALQRTQIDLEARQLDTETSLFRARQQLTEIDRDRIDLEARRRQEGLDQLQQARAELDRLKVRETMLRQILTEVGVGALLGGQEELAPVVTYRITRDGTTSPILATTNTGLEPLDVLEVEMALPEDEALTGN